MSTTYQWRRDGVAIDGATALTYVLQAADAGAMIDCVETVANGGGTVSATTNELGPILAGEVPTLASIGEIYIVGA